jgi:hypothetical protein
MMRYAITIVATGEYEKAMKICSILRTVDLSKVHQ